MSLRILYEKTHSVNVSNISDRGILRRNVLLISPTDTQASKDPM